ncbi:holin family protein [uncultured Oscillibacter sp.]|uniref:phage holin family protein n=1 Tax=uncultured Oscillibacter sp. TaxID=876091 RepID=UPI0025F5F1E4|nr:phage holin family protein [uncultured Oscillibacter sp.]
MNENTMVRLKAGLSGLVAVLTALWGWFGWLVVAWVGLMLSDWLIGSAVAAKEGRWSSARLREGAWHKAGMVVVVCVALAADWLIGTMMARLPGVTLPFTYSVLLGPMVIVWYIVGELGSLAEHAVAMGAPVPGWIVRVLEISKDALDGAAGGMLGGEEEKKD